MACHGNLRGNKIGRRIPLVAGEEIKKGSTVKTVLPVRFAAIQLLLVLPAHPWQLFLWSPDQFILKRLLPASHHPDAISPNPWVCPDLPDPPDILSGSHSPSWRCPLTRSCAILLLLPEAFPWITFPVCPMKRHHPDVHFVYQLPVDVYRIPDSAPSYNPC